MDLLKETDICMSLTFCLISDDGASGQWIWKNYDGFRSFSSNGSFPVNHWQVEIITDTLSVWRWFLRCLLWLNWKRIYDRSNQRWICHDALLPSTSNEIYLKRRRRREKKRRTFLFIDLVIHSIFRICRSANMTINDSHQRDIDVFFLYIFKSK